MRPTSHLVHTFVTALSIAVLSTSGAAQAKHPTNPLAGFDRWVDSAMAKGGGVGLAIAIVKDDSIVYAKGFGVRKLGDPAPVTPRTLFAIGSTTKAMTATALGMLVDEGRLTWDDKVADRLPTFRLLDPNLTRELTIADLLTHRTGLPGTDDRLWMGSRYSRAEVIRRVQFLKAAHPVRTQFDYFNIGFLTAGEIVAVVSGTSWDAFIRDRIFRPLRMESSNTSIRDLGETADVATPHDLRAGKVVPIKYRNIDNIGPAGSVNSNVLDMAQWIRFNLSGAKYAGRQLLNPATHRTITTPHMLVGADPTGSPVSYGFGWALGRSEGFNIIEHGGGIDGMITNVTMAPSEHLGVVVLSNNGASNIAGAVGLTALDRYLGIKANRLAGITPLDSVVATNLRLEDSLDGSRAKSSHPSLPLEAYAGSYWEPMYGLATVSVRDGKLVFQPVAFRDELPLGHWQYDTFRGEWADPIFGHANAAFRLEPTGAAIAGVTVEGLTNEFKRVAPGAVALSCEPSTPDLTQLAGRTSPYDSVDIGVGDRAARVCYSRPAMRGRKVFGSELVPFDTLWRTGANDPTIIHLPFAAEIAGIKVGPGKYSLYTVPGPARWIVVVNALTTQGGLTRDEGQFKNNYTAEVRAKEAGRSPVARESIPDPVERFTIRWDLAGPTNGDLLLEWETTRVRIPIKRAP